uniref:Uncharacterized protein n=1 Tax=Lates calcarifer TaxID=8187 RepID=A0A4W6CM44_LATCA
MNTGEEEQFLHCARNGDLTGIQKLLMSKIREETLININCKDSQRCHSKCRDQKHVGR